MKRFLLAVLSLFAATCAALGQAAPETDTAAATAVSAQTSTAVAKILPAPLPVPAVPDAAWQAKPRSIHETVRSSACVRDLIEVLSQSLTPIERLVLWDFFAGMEVNEIARKEGITHQKVSTHRQRICTRAVRLHSTTKYTEQPSRNQIRNVPINRKGTKSAKKDKTKFPLCTAIVSSALKPRGFMLPAAAFPPLRASARTSASSAL